MIHQIDKLQKQKTKTNNNNRISRNHRHLQVCPFKKNITKLLQPLTVHLLMWYVSYEIDSKFVSGLWDGEKKVNWNHCKL